MVDNGRYDMIVPKNEAAKTESGFYYYKLVIVPTYTTDPYGSNAFKIRINGTICINEGKYIEGTTEVIYHYAKVIDISEEDIPKGSQVIKSETNSNATNISSLGTLPKTG